jgi:AcrR family transcriptional regulator
LTGLGWWRLIAFGGNPVPRAKPREKAVEALLALAAERPFETVTLADIAARADLTLAVLRESYDGRMAILADYVRHVDERVLAGVDPALVSESPRERLFDVLFARFDAHAPNRAALHSIARSVGRDPLLALELNRIVTTSMSWMLTAAGISTNGGRGAFRAQGLSLIWAQVMRVWLNDEEPGLARTMAALDKRLRGAERMVIRLQRLERCLPRRRSTERRREAGADGDIAEGHPT